METLDFFKELRRMCKVYIKERCLGCPLRMEGCEFLYYGADDDAIMRKVEKHVKVVEDWSKNNLVKTRLSEFLKMYPNAPLVDGLPVIFPCDIDDNFSKTFCNFDACGRECKEKYWNEVIE